MTTIDPAAEIAALKAAEKAQDAAWPAAPAPDVAKLKKAHVWPDASKDGKKPPRHAARWLTPQVTYRPLVLGGLTVGEIARALLLLGGMIAAALLID